MRLLVERAGVVKVTVFANEREYSKYKNRPRCVWSMLSISSSQLARFVLIV